jgi:uncharacterized membrane protein
VKALRTSYNHIAGQSIERLAALSDGVFAVAMTLLVLDLRTPAETTIHSEIDLWHAIVALAPRVLVYLMSFLTLGIFWVGQQTQLNHFSHGDRHITGIHLIFLFCISLMPFSTSLMAVYISYRLALLVYWANIFILGTTLFAGWRYAVHAQLVKKELSADFAAAIERRIIIAQTLYAVGALLCLFNTYWSIGFILLVQINYAIAPRSGPLSRL